MDALQEVNNHMAGDALPALRVNPPRIDPDIARRIRVVGLDVDGVLTDGGLYLGAVAGDPVRRVEIKRFDTQDGLGIYFLREAGLHVVIITGRVSESVRIRGAELGVHRVIQDPHARKLPALMNYLEEIGCTTGEVAFIGDDIPDLPVLRAIALPVAVANATSRVMQIAKLRLLNRGGYGAVREFAEALLDARDEWNDIVERYVEQRSSEAMS